MNTLLLNLSKEIIDEVSNCYFLTQSQVIYLELLAICDVKLFFETINSQYNLTQKLFCKNNNISEISSDIQEDLSNNNKRTANDNTLLQIIASDNIERYIKRGYLLCYDKHGNIYLTCYNLTSLPIILSDLLKLEISKQLENFKKHKLDNINILLISKRNFYHYINWKFQEIYLIKSTQVLKSSAKNLEYQKIIISIFTVILLMVLKYQNAFFLINYLIYLFQLVLKFFLFLTAAIHIKKTNALIPYYADTIEEQKSKLPIYSILIPLYQEDIKIKSILNFLDNMNYPKNLMDVHIILEEDDLQTITTLQNITLPEYINVLIIPNYLPKTKPKALNYGIQYCRGEYVVVYDAEDIPDSNQLLDAVKLFNELPQEYICLQALLDFFNKDENLLTKFFSVEYNLWFNYLLTGLSKCNLPITLGGTSNHFKTDIIRKIGLWDAYNVTEDAELGIRLYLEGYKTQILPSYTLEEAPTSVFNWLKQRTRWIKGFIQTICVFSRQPKKLSLAQTSCIYLFVGAASYSFIILPWFFITNHTNTTIIKPLMICNFSIACLYLYTNIFMILKKNFFTKGYKTAALNFVALLLWPLYFLLHTVAGYLAIVELLFAPFHWNKTQHGTSKFREELL